MTERGRPRSFDRAQALRKAMEVFWSKGYEGTSLTDLTAAMGINSPSLYAAFGCKEALFREAVALYQTTDGSATKTALENAPTVRDAFAQMLLAAAERFTAIGLPPGCLIVQGAIAGATTHPTIGDFLRGNRQAMQAHLLARLDQGVAQGEISSQVDLKNLAAFYTTVLHGMSLQACDGATRATLQAIAHQAMSAWDTLIGKTTA